jgi:hypothetical protein
VRSNRTSIPMGADLHFSFFTNIVLKNKHFCFSSLISFIPGMVCDYLTDTTACNCRRSGLEKTWGSMCEIFFIFFMQHWGQEEDSRSGVAKGLQ